MATGNERKSEEVRIKKILKIVSPHVAVLMALDAGLLVIFSETNNKQEVKEGWL